MTAANESRPRVLIAEDGDEYFARFSRLLGAQFAFERVSSFAALLLALQTEAAVLVLDLDFRRADRALLVDARGAPVPDAEVAEAAQVQGLCILRALRARGQSIPALLCADVDEPERARLLREELAPLDLSPSVESLPAVAARLHALAKATSAG